MPEPKEPVSLPLDESTERGPAWTALYERFGELPVPPERVWEVQALLTRALAQLAQVTAERDELKCIVEQVDDVLIVDWVNPPGIGGDYRKALAEMVGFNVKIALDPAVSSEAKALVDRAEAAEAKLAQPDGWIAVTAEKWAKALDLLDRFAESEAYAPDPTWNREYYELRGYHMILTDEGWQPGDVKASIIEEFDEGAILDEVNAPTPPVQAVQEKP